MGPWRRIKSWVKRAVVRICLKFTRSRFARFVRKIGEASAVPLFITGAGAFLGIGMASAAVCPLAYGALIGAGVTMAGVIVTRLYLKNAADARSQKAPDIDLHNMVQKGNEGHLNIGTIFT